MSAKAELASDSGDLLASSMEYQNTVDRVRLQQAAMPAEALPQL
ncbi:hypothetical protein [Mesorhizobium australicum]